MLRHYIGDLLGSTTNVIAHQTNCVGVMGAGVALQIRRKLLTSEQYEEYQEKCKTMPLGECQLLQIEDNRYVANLFGENIPTGDEVDTDYDALRKAMTALADFCRTNNYSVSFPGLLGCGLAGGDWNIVMPMIKEIFSDIDTRIVWFREADYMANRNIG